ncbi:glycosyltransferase family 4 protein [Telmatospirillum sp.]|uniref:glycosyltransferase family 4 protein n=1 Tax=Telmatospirillum sp. TaxID=2079197 RepID=UPI002851AECE|nr:glycosyltransferase family 4 protein [Telmatospirillum sp.]MDR3435682.1 glycosyltransferase family 4 protein [Telmatospirillum sp.]
MTALIARPLQDLVPPATPDGWWTPIGREPLIGLCPPAGRLAGGWVALRLDIETPAPAVELIARTAAGCGAHVTFCLPRPPHGRIETLLRLPDRIEELRLLPAGGDETFRLGTIDMRPTGKLEAALRLGWPLLRRRLGSPGKALQGLAALGRTLLSQGPRRTLIGLADDILAASSCRPAAHERPAGFPAPSTIDLFDDDGVAEACGSDRRHILWPIEEPGEIADRWAAARFCIDLLRGDGALRQRFPDALSAGAAGAFATWLASDGNNRFSLSQRSRDAIAEVFSDRPSARVRHIVSIRDDLRAAYPLGSTPAGRRELLRWLLGDGRQEHDLRLEEIWWFALECAERPAAELVASYLFQPAWQAEFPDGLTVFGRRRLSDWLVSSFGLRRSAEIDESPRQSRASPRHSRESGNPADGMDPRLRGDDERGDWAAPDAWPVDLSPAQQIRLAAAANPSWRQRHPDAFITAEGTGALLDWLTSGRASVPAEAEAWCAGLDHDAVVAELLAGGVNILGHYCYPSGLRTSTLSLTEGLRRVGMPIARRDIWTAIDDDDPDHAAFDGLEIYDTTIIHAQPAPFFATAYRRAGLAPRHPRTYRIGYWYWELDQIPESWEEPAAQLDELWAATHFVADALRQRFDLPVIRMMPGVELPSFAPCPRPSFGLAEDRFTFLFVFHMTSIMERKNPLGLIRAYRQAFGDDPRTSLVLKTSFGDKHPDLLAELRAAAAGSGIVIIDQVFGQDQTLALMQAADCYVSLHRSEGFGLTMAEAMLQGKPVIATGYSGNVDFMDASNSLLVDHRIVTLDHDCPPYPAGSRWAEPSVDHAAALMRQVFENQAWARELGARAKADLGNRMSLAAAGRRMAARLRDIEQQRRQPAGTSSNCCPNLLSERPAEPSGSGPR